ncbi:MAG: glutathione S-transferase family protein [Alphaproteobacteria bacterium]|nr:glutathione S-transferase family protein [Alphaproteobacteria bacterium]
MIDLYTFGTPNGQKVSIMLEEVGLPYRVHTIDILKGDQFKPEFLAISPNNKIPAIVDNEGPGGKPYSLLDSGAILLYLAEKTGKLMPAEMAARHEVVQWLMFQIGHIGPMLGQAHHFLKFVPEKVPYAIERFRTEANRLYGVMERRLAAVAYLARAYSIADIACWTWTRTAEWQGVAIDDYPSVKRWQAAIAGRPAVQRGISVP